MCRNKIFLMPPEAAKISNAIFTCSFTFFFCRNISYSFLCSRDITLSKSSNFDRIWTWPVISDKISEYAILTLLYVLSKIRERKLNVSFFSSRSITPVYCLFVGSITRHSITNTLSSSCQTQNNILLLVKAHKNTWLKYNWEKIIIASALER